MIVFIPLALALVACSVAVIATKDLIHAVLLLGGTLMLTAGAYVALEADFVAAVQLMLYTGGVVTLLLFGVMLSQRVESARVLVHSKTWHRGLLSGLAFFALAAWAILSSELPASAVLIESDAQAVGKLFLTRHVAAFETLSVLLLAAMIGAIVLARKTDA